MNSDISVTIEADRATVTLRGEHEAYTSQRLDRKLSALQDEGMPVTIDLRQTSFVDSTVVGVLLAAKRRADAYNLDFVLRLGEETGWPVRRVLEVTGLDRTFHVVG